MKLIEKIFNVELNKELKQGRVIYKLVDIKLDDKDNLIPSIGETYLTKQQILSNFSDKTYSNFLVKDSNIKFDEDMTLMTVDKQSFLQVAATKNTMPKIENLISLLDFLRREEALLFTNSFARTTHAVTQDGVYEEIEDIYMANFKNIRYSSKHLSISLPYVVRGNIVDLTVQYSNTVERMASANIVDKNGVPVESFTALLSEDSINLFKSLVPESHYTLLENINSDQNEENTEIDKRESRLSNQSPTPTYLIGKSIDNKYTLKVNTKNLLNYSMIIDGNLNIMCNQNVIRRSVHALNATTRLIKAYREGNKIIKENLMVQGYAIEDDSSNIYRFEPIDKIDEQIDAKEIEFYLKGKKTIPSMTKLLTKYNIGDNLLDFVNYCISSNKYTQVKEIVTHIDKTLGLDKANLTILDGDALLSTLTEDTSLECIPYTGFLNATLVTDGDLFAKYIENKVTIETLEKERELYKARLSYVRYCINSKMQVPMLSKDKIKIDIVENGVRTQY